MAQSYEHPHLSYECDLTRQRDELVAALRTLADAATLERYENNELRAMVVEHARAALAKVA